MAPHGVFRSSRSCRRAFVLLFLPAWAAHLGSSTEPVTTIEGLVDRYNSIFGPFGGNRNAASHLWVSFILAQASQVDKATLETLFRGFCPVSGSPLPSDTSSTLFSSTLERLDGSAVDGYTHHCCWPCICDLQESVRVDTLSVTTSDGEEQFDVLVIGDPCEQASLLNASFDDPFSGHNTSLWQEAPAVRCEAGKLKGAVFSDGGHPIIGMYLTGPPAEPAAGQNSGDEASAYQDMCEDRAEQGYTSGMGLIFNKVAAISPLAAGEGGTSLLANKSYSTRFQRAGTMRGTKLAVRP